ncbi:MAG: HypC/HybG/HupF family hydrogenase formation chaperone [Candidatus Latescibacterota bacterium]|nr:MAG: HypC/HybG/HupF family hydrogenase formation chaperone [Candidatus Latescibacterota bacterium]
MCLAIPGKIIEIIDDDPLSRRGKVDFGGILKDVNLSFVPDAGRGDYVLVHVGFALNTVDESEATRVFEHMGEIGELSELQGGVR